MFQEVLVATDRHDVAEETVRHLTARERRFLSRLKGILLDLVLPTGDSAATARPTAIEVQSDHATRHAIDLASRHGARLHVLFTVDSLRYDTTVEFATEPLVEEGEERVEAVLDEAARAGVTGLGTVEVGRPARLILDYVGAHDIDLVVLNARPWSGLLARLWGDRVSAVVRGSPVPVYVVPRVQPGHPD